MSIRDVFYHFVACKKFQCLQYFRSGKNYQSKNCRATYTVRDRHGVLEILTLKRWDGTISGKNW